jgi:phosphogluconate dehydratase
MSGASGKVPAAIHITPECTAGGPLAKVRNGDMIRVDGNNGVVEALVEQTEWDQREIAVQPIRDDQTGCGRELFAGFRRMASGAEQGATVALS